MNMYLKVIFIAFIIAFCRIISFAQDSLTVNSTLIFPEDTISFKLIATPIRFSSWSFFDTIIYHSPSEEDTLNARKFRKLVQVEPTKKNISNYFKLASSLCELGQLKEAEKMFLKIMNSKNPYFEKTYLHSSDIPGDTNNNIYGYGSFTSNLKNEVCIYLAKIYIERKKFDQALNYLRDSERLYLVNYYCGTGHRMHINQMNSLYGFSYMGLERYDSIVNMFLPNFYDYNVLLIKALRKIYSPSEINIYLEEAEKSLICKTDSIESVFYVQEGDIYLEKKYTLGKGSMKLFGKDIDLPYHYPQEGLVENRDLLLKEFQESWFCTELKSN